MGAEDQRSRDAAPVGDAPSGDHRNDTGDVDNGRDEHHRRHPPGVPARLCPLGDQNVGPRVESDGRRLGVTHGLHPHDAAFVCRRDEIGGDAHVEGDGHRSEVQGRGERLVVERPPGVVDGERPVGEVTEPMPLLTQLGHRTHGRTETAQRSGFTDRRGELHLVPGAERRQHDRHVDVQQVAQAVTHEHH